MPIIDRQQVGYILVFVAIYAVVLAAATTAGGDGLPATQAHPESIGPSGVGAARPDVRTSEPGALERVHTLRVRKCQAVVRALYPDSGFLPYCEFFISEHERQGIVTEWQWSLAYGGANCSLRCNIRFRNGCTGPMDRPRGPKDPEANIRAHCAEAVYYHRTKGERGYALARRVFYPARPHDWHGGQIRKAYRRHIDAIHEAYQRGELK